MKREPIKPSSAAGEPPSANEGKTKAERAARATSGRTYALRVVSGSANAASLALADVDNGSLLVGKSEACALRVEDELVSRRHCAFELAGDRLRVRDLDSTNGTFVNGVRVESAILGGGELVRLGAVTLHVEVLAAAGGASAPARAAFGNYIGSSPEMQRLYPVCDRLAAAMVPVLIEGETGTGKEVMAEALHEMGPRAKGPFVVFDCTATAASLLEAALFGHEKGAFTGAVETRRGVFEQAHGGTLLIDEIGDLDLSLQAKLLRAIERSEVRRVGADKWTRVDVRVIAATRRNLDREIHEGRFRDDLFYRLAVARIELPPLRRRPGDIAALAGHFWSALGGSEGGPPDDVLGRYLALEWPGNVRELHNAVARRLALGDLADLTPRVSQPSGDDGSPEERYFARVLATLTPFPEARDRVLHDFTRYFVQQLLERHGGSVAKAAAASGIARRYFHTLRTRSDR